MPQATESRTLADVIDAGRVEVTIEGLGYRGEGFVRLDDGWLSVRNALPGERVVVEVEAPRRGRPRRVWGRLVDVVESVPRRSPPHCERIRRCRGCHLRVVSMADELAIKANTVAECLEKFAGVPADQMPEIETIAVAGATRADAFRVRTALTVRRTDDGWETGIRGDGDVLVEMGTCPALADSARRAVARFDEALASFRPAPDVPEIVNARIAAPVHGHGYVDLVVEAWDDDFFPLLDALDEILPASFGVAATTVDGERRHTRGPQRFRLPTADLPLEVGFDDWFHATLDPAEALYDAITRWLQPSAGERVLDAGCGIGTIGLICANRGADVVGFDVNPASVETAELNAIRNDLDVEFYCAGWERAFRDRVLDADRFDTVVINPMRDPLGKRALAYIPRLDTSRVLYLGPSAAPASRDVGSLLELGFELKRLGAANLHPATYHVMLVALLER
jgi:23S rRNA (uracil1939-C5)-methyltransferase